MAKSAFQTPLTIKELLEGINQNYFLPSIQREFVWGTEKITKLFDSLMRGYPIGSFLFWEVSANNTAKYQFYEFIRLYHELTRKHNDEANLTGKNKNIQAILDGQQRITSLYIGLKGSYSEKLKRKKKNDPNSYPEKKLYINLLEKLDDLDKDMMYDFKFLTDTDAQKRDEKHFWFKVGNILSDELNNPYKYLGKNEIDSEIAEDILSTLHEVIRKERCINYYLESSEELDKVLNIFIRVNSGGMVLNPSDLFLSFATANIGDGRNLREEIYKFVDVLNNIGGIENFAIDKDFVLKALLVLSTEIKSIKFKASNFDKNNMSVIGKNLDKINRAIELAVLLIDEYGFSGKDFKSNNSIIPLAHYIFNKDNAPENYAKDKPAMIHWFIAATIGGTFGASTDTVLNRYRKILSGNHANFPLEEMIGNDFKNNLVNTILDLGYKDTPILMALHILFSHVDLKNSVHHIDHIFPKSKFNDTIFDEFGISGEDKKFYEENCNSILNLQLLPGTQNQSKSDQFFDEWLEKEFKGKPAELQNYKTLNCIPDGDLSFGNFKKFIEKREKLIRSKLETNLKTWKII